MVRNFEKAFAIHGTEVHLFCSCTTAQRSTRRPSCITQYLWRKTGLVSWEKTNASDTTWRTCQWMKLRKEVCFVFPDFHIMSAFVFSSFTSFGLILVLSYKERKMYLWLFKNTDI